jgi:hypothetical protein
VYGAVAPGCLPLYRYSKGLQWRYSLSGSSGGRAGFESYVLDTVAYYLADSQRPGTLPVYI